MRHRFDAASPATDQGSIAMATESPARNRFSLAQHSRQGWAITEYPLPQEDPAVAARPLGADRID